MKNKIETMRMSGLPVDPEEYAEFNKKWKDVYDKVLEKYLPEQNENFTDNWRVQQPIIQKILDRYERMLQHKYKSIVDWNEITTAEEWNKVVTDHGPVLIAKAKDTDKIVYVIADQLQ